MYLDILSHLDGVDYQGHPGRPVRRCQWPRTRCWRAQGAGDQMSMSEKEMNKRKKYVLDVKSWFNQGRKLFFYYFFGFSPWMPS